MPHDGPSPLSPSLNGGQHGRFTLGNFAIDEYKPIKVIVIGAGFSGILAAIRFPQKIPNVELSVYEKSDGIGGTWYNNKYPGVACDIPAHCYQYTFEEKRNWSAIYPPGHEIQEYLQGVVDKYKLMRYIKLKHEMVGAQYDEAAGKWHVRVRRTAEDGQTEEFDDVADVLFTAIGALARWKLPDIPGIADYKGELHHTAGYKPGGKTWEDDVKAWKDKRVAVIGSGSTAIQVVPALAPHVASLTTYVRGQTWLSPPFSLNVVQDLIGRPATGVEETFALRPEEIERFQSDPEFFTRFRHQLENTLNVLHPFTQRGSKMQSDFHQFFKKNMEDRLATRPDIAEKLIPDFPVSCRRLTPGPGYLETLLMDHVDFISSPIKKFTETGIETEDGQTKDLDLVFCATGFDASWQLPYKIVGRNGVELNTKWKPHPTSYLSMCVDGFPNMFMSLGPNSVIGAGVLLPIIEYAVMYAVQATAKMQRERLKSMEVKLSAVKDFDNYIESYFPQSVFSAKCRSWYKLGKEEGRIIGLWPGSNLHAVKALQYPRWEDYEYERADAEGNSLYWLGDGQSLNEKNNSGDRAWYLTEEFVDRPPVPQD